MIKLKSWIGAARLRTLPLSLSGIIVGTAIAAHLGYFSIEIFALALATTLGLQILSNFANDYGDGVKGTDNDERIGPQRALQSGLITHQEMKTGIIITSVVTLLIAVSLIYVAFGSENFIYSILFFFLGIGAIAAAIKYTVGESAYGYKGLGDIFVFLFFGLVSVYGSYFLYANQLNALVLLPATAIGFLSAGVLNLNNMRDREPDERAGKITLAVKLGLSKARNYHYFLIFAAICCMLIYTVLSYQTWVDFLYIITFIPLLLHVNRVMKNKLPKLLDPELKFLSLSTFALALLFAVGAVL
ncbi:1,4-dihydroxy-2-naphthoate polyprenyltransferase [Zunongwangia sp.]|uniref:1,4-dihydroxy-2-naphthoate polyprenyltransferase n=1 Tax=Zunongwangia sp. TaxID=1965325 RepID=UPI003AA943FD